ncbi:MAG: 3-deoxy-manno-octulosonate cytidylyltransferase [Pseudomonadota bacterium]|nr:3-deoxy-manno-octulosonate cytidylyltransferase [Pseudomonadota bacterium]
MSRNTSPVIVIPARMAASRLPGKPLADIAGKPMIQHVWERAMAAGIAPVWVATDDQRIADAIHGAGGNAVITREDHPSGSDRTFEAVQLIDPEGRFDVILNLQGDLPELDPQIPATLLAAVETSGAELSTLVTLADETEASRPQIVKAVVAWDKPQATGPRFGTALYFSRAAVPTGPAAKYHHIGVYGWRRDALAAFVSLPPSPLETTERLEQLRALEAGMRIAVAEIDEAPAGVDTEEDLAATRRRLGH